MVWLAIWLTANKILKINRMKAIEMMVTAERKRFLRMAVAAS